MKQVLELTNSDSGRLVASKLYRYIHNLQAYYRHYAEQSTNPQSDGAALKIVHSELRNLKIDLTRIIIKAARQGLDDIDEKVEAELAAFDKKIHAVAAQQNPDHIHHIAKLNFASTVVYYGTIVASYLTKGLQGFLHSLPTLLSSLGRVFPPIIIALDAIKNIFDITYSLATHYHLSKKEKKSHYPLASAPLYHKGYSIRLIGNTLALALNLFTLLIFTGALFTTPFGWALSAAVVAAEWVSGCVIPAWQAWRNYKKLTTEAAAYQTQIHEQEQQESGASEQKQDELLPSKRQAILEKLQANAALAKKNYLMKRKDAIWSSFSIIGSILFACGFLFPPLFVLGIVSLLASPTRSTLIWLKDKSAKCRKRPEPDTPEGEELIPILDFNTPSILNGLFAHKPEEVKRVHTLPAFSDGEQDSPLPSRVRHAAPVSPRGSPSQRMKLLGERNTPPHSPIVDPIGRENGQGGKRSFSPTS
jgi:hypothetical protein